MFLALIRRASASPHGRRSPPSVETRVAAQGSSMHPTDRDVTCFYFYNRLFYNEPLPFFSLPDLPVMNFCEKQGLYDYSNFPATWNSSCMSNM
jgi:hypothetical protein